MPSKRDTAKEIGLKDKDEDHKERNVR